MSSHDEDSISRQVLAQFDAPAFVRRARGVEEAWERIVGRGRIRREEWLQIPRLRLATLQARLGEWERLNSHLADVADGDRLRALFDHWQPKLRVAVFPTSDRSEIESALILVITTFTGFNRRWSGYVVQVDFSHVNQLRTDYNRFYLLEKECALRSPTVARQGYRPLSPAGPADLLAQFPLLPIPQLQLPARRASEGPGQL